MIKFAPTKWPSGQVKKNPGVSATSSEENILDWYARTAFLYGFSDPYRKYREVGISKAQISSGDTVLDLCCGGGANLALLAESVGETGKVYGFDASPEMLKRARSITENRKNVTLVEGKAKELLSLCQTFGKFDHIFCSFGLTVIPEWRQTVEDSMKLLRPDGSYTVIDYYFESRTVPCRFIDWLGHSDSLRKVWEPLTEKCSTSSRQEFPFFRGKIYVFNGRK